MASKADWKTIAFSPRGRINRQRFWIITGVVFTAQLAASVLANGVQALDKNGPFAFLFFAAAAVILLTVFLLTYVGLVATIKRLHDRDRPGVFYLIVFIPIVGAIWLFIETGCLAGTVGRNQFGPDPNAPHDDIARIFDAPGPPPALP